MERWNAGKPAERYRGKSWELLHDRSTHVAGDIDDRSFEADLPPIGRTFPHELGDDEYLYLRLSLSPVGDELTLDLTKALFDAEQLGQGAATAFLAASFSSTDYVGHLFGPSSLESEDNLLRLDRVLTELSSHVDEKIGLENTLIMLSADHGAPDAPEHAAAIGMETGLFDFDYFKKPGPLTEALEKRFGCGDLITTHSHPYLYLDHKVLAEAGLGAAEVERFLADQLMQLPGIAYAMTRTDLLEGRVAGAPLRDKIRRSFHPWRSGNIHLLPEPYWFLHSTEEAHQMGLAGIAAIHGSPWSYDTFVPIFFAGPRVPRGKVYRAVGPQDIACTLAASLGIEPPSCSVGTPLVEVLPGVANQR